MAFTLGKLVYEIAMNDTGFQKSLQKYDKELTSFSDKATKTGKALTRNLTLPIVGLGTVALKLASDFEVSSKKFTKAFQGATDQANKSVENLNENYGLAITQSTALLANTGDLLKGFGATSEEALNLSESATELAASLAAYNGVPIAQASEAIKSALVGEREALKQLGVVVSEEAVKKQLLADGTADLTGQELLLAKANATLTLSYQQSADAIESFQENTDTASFQTAQLIGDLKDLSVQFGTILLPVLKDVVGEISEVVEWFADLDDQQKENIIRLLAITAAIPPLITSLGGLSKALTVLGSANVGLVAVAAAIATIATGVVVISKAVEESSKIAEINKKLADGTATYEEKLSVVNKRLAEANFESLKQRDVLNSNRGKAAENARLRLYEIETEIAGIRRIKTAIETERDTALKALEDKLNAEKKLVEEKAKEEELTNKQVEAYIKQNEQVQAVLQSEKTEIELIDEQIAAITELSLKDSTFRDDQQKAVEVLQARKQALYNEDLAEIEEKLTKEAEAEKELADYQTELANEVAAEKERLREQELLAIQQTGSFILGQITSIQQQEVTNAKARYDNFQTLNNAEISDLENKEKSGEKLTAKEQKRLDELNEKKKELANEQYERELTAFKTEKALSLSRVAIAGYEASVQAYKALAGIPVIGPGLGIAAAGAVGVFTGLQLESIASQEPPPKPVFLAEGGIVNPTVSGTPAVIGEAGSPEAVIPLNDNFFNRIASAATGASLGGIEGSEGGNMAIIYNVLDGNIIAENTVNLINNRVYTIDNRSIR